MGSDNKTDAQKLKELANTVIEQEAQIKSQKRDIQALSMAREEQRKVLRDAKDRVAEAESINKTKAAKTFGITSGAFTCITLLGCLFLYGCPQYNVWQKTLQGKAELKQAEWNRQIKIQEAKAKLESSKALAKAEVERAKGVAQANQIIGDSLKNNESYLRYLYIQGLQDKDNNIIYVPTEAGLPILEAGKR